MTTLVAAKLPKITKELVDELDRTFRQITIKADTDYKKILFNAGQRDVIEWLRARVQDSILTGDVSAINKH